MKKALVCGAGGFIGAHMVKKLKEQDFWVRGADLKRPPYCDTAADEFFVGDLSKSDFCESLFDTKFDEIYQFAADMGGAGYVFTGENDYDIMNNSVLINLNVINSCISSGNKKVFYSSSACMYPEYNQVDPNDPNCKEDSAYPAMPDSEYGWEKLFSERMYFAAKKNKGLEPRVARYHNIFGPEGSWDNGKEKAPAAICRKVAQANNNGEIEIWGDGKQTRSFLYIDECIEATQRFMRSDWIGPVNIGSDEMVSINQLAQMVISLSNKAISIKNIDGPLGVRGRNSENSLYKKMMGWRVSQPLIEGIKKTYPWIDDQLQSKGKDIQE
ncbi:NAD-dependent epimerase/dehydratase family protein [Pelagibacteraceae bacterium]|nr:NAD-dependent epimerase/dehydratase family protein [Pelagibacteraceae bacterium]